MVDGWDPRKQEIDRGRPVEGALVGIEKRERGSGTKERDGEGICVEGEREKG